MKISDKFYNFIKYACAVALPAINTALLALTAVFNWEWGQQASQVLIIANTLLAALFCISIAGYTAENKDGTIVVEKAVQTATETDTDTVNTETEGN